MKHVFEPTDNQGHSMECLECGKSISIYLVNEWNKSIDEKCPSADNHSILSPL